MNTERDIARHLSATLDMDPAWHAAHEIRAQSQALSVTAQAIKPVTVHTQNPLRPWWLADVIGQERVKVLLRRIIDAAKAKGQPLDHMLLIGAAGTGKTTLGYVVAHELGTQVFQLEAPVTSEQLLELRTSMRDGDVLIIDEVHRQVVPDRRGVGSTGGAELLYHALEDRTLVTSSGILTFPKITVIACTTDAGLLPPSFIDRFPLQPRLEPYQTADMMAVANYNTDALGMTIDPDAALIFARSSRGVPRLVNRYVKNAEALSANGHIDAPLAIEVVTSLNSTTLDGCDLDMQNMLRFIYRHGKRVKSDGSVVYQASVNSVATALGKSRDSKYVALYVEPYLIENGLLTVQSRGRELTPAGIKRAQELS